MEFPWNWLAYGLVTAGTFLFWEFVAWWTHKYVMHGFLWTWHKSHHTRHKHTFEKNDLFGVVFSVPSILLFVFGFEWGNPWMVSVALGILAYGLFYLVFHDFIVHQRIKWKIRNRPTYLNRMINAHYVHHSKHSKEGCEAFGFLVVPKKYETRNLRIRADRTETQ
jgi:beta-carotene 3-hydroxylase